MLPSRSRLKPFPSQPPRTLCNPRQHQTRRRVDLERHTALRTTTSSFPLFPHSYSASIDVVTVDFHKATASTEPPLRVFLNFGEHGRELITTDVGLHVLRLLARCRNKMLCT